MRDILVNQLQQWEAELKQLITVTEKSLYYLPEGRLRAERHNNSLNFYIKTSLKDTHGKYIKKCDRDLAYKLAQKEYNQKLLRVARKERDRLQSLLAYCNQKPLENVYCKMPDIKKQLITPYYLPDNEYVKCWEQKDYEIWNTEEDDAGIYTEKGERVRSKSEKILADKFAMLKIPYHYEKPLILKGFGLIHPDFTLLNIKTRQTIYWEHFGRMNDSEYCEKAIKKIEAMQKNGIYQGINLLCSYETQGHSLNMKYVEELIKKFLV